MLCPYCNQEHPDEMIDCPITGNKLKRACNYSLCSYYGEFLFPLEQETCPCCGKSLVDTHNGHKFVDLGLSVKWATCNIGANSPDNYGDYFAWGETIGNKPQGYSWETYFDSNCNEYNINKSCSKGVLTQENDAAHIIWGGLWRIPTSAEIEELFDSDNCIWRPTSRGYKIISKKPGYTGNYIFLPAAGIRIGKTVNDTTTINYWSSSLGDGKSNRAICLASYNDVICDYQYPRCQGRPIRPVCK